jgi:thiol-disulfide isomerase/thioredoxin
VTNLSSRFIACVLFASLALSSAAQAADETITLKPGDAAPPLKADKWIKGEPIKALEKGKVYVIECWATWCGPCRTSIPHVSEIQKKYADKGLIVIGMDVWENDESKVEPFVKEMGDKMDYRVATDPGGGQNGTMATTWMKASGQHGIPCSFIVDRDTKIAWIGHPMQMERPLEKVLDGKFDVEAEKKVQETVQAGQKQFMEAMQAKDFDKAIKAVDDVIAADPGAAKMYKPAKLFALFGKKDYKAANALAKELGEENAKDQMMLTQLSMMMASQEDTKGVDMKLALSLAEKAAAMEGTFTWMANAAVAKIHATNGDFAKAVESQKKAIELSKGPERNQLKSQLEEYEKKATKEVK